VHNTDVLLPSTIAMTIIQQYGTSDSAVYSSQETTPVSSPSSDNAFEKSFQDALSRRISNEAKLLSHSFSAGSHVNTSSAVISPFTSYPASPTMIKSKKRTSSGTYSQCGRHANQWLFNNFSIKDTVKGIFDHNRRDT